MSSNSQKKKKVFLGSSKLQCGLHINIIYFSFMFQKVEHYERSITICLGDKHGKHFKPPQWASSILYFYHTYQNMIKTSSNWKASLNLAFDLMCNLDFFTPWHWNSTTIFGRFLIIVSIKIFQKKPWILTFLLELKVVDLKKNMYIIFRRKSHP